MRESGRLAIAPSRHDGKSAIAMRSIGDLVSGEIERTLEISNQTIIDAAVDMSAFPSASQAPRPNTTSAPTSTPHSVVNANIPPRPERVSIRPDSHGMRMVRMVEDTSNVGGSESPYPPRLEGPGQSSDAGTGPPLEGLAYPQHRPKSPPHANMHHGLATLAHVAFNRNPIHYPSQQAASSAQSQSQSQSQAQARHRPPSAPYTPVQLPRADIKPYHESYFTDSKPPLSSAKAPSRSESTPSADFAPVEGLAATLHARILNGQELGSSATSGPSTSTIKEEADESSHTLMAADSSRLPHEPSPDLDPERTRSADGHLEDKPQSCSADSSIKMEGTLNGPTSDRTSNRPDRPPSKRSSPLIHGPSRPFKKQCLDAAEHVSLY
ncbi:hypothetical protein FOCC_FOCC006374 [Frankliniella occidentalis]|nr:hypothetical protein FOCC_FOCC006374 [Frankliniella occidentalis]